MKIFPKVNANFYATGASAFVKLATRSGEKECRIMNSFHFCIIYVVQLSSLLIMIFTNANIAIRDTVWFIWMFGSMKQQSFCAASFIIANLTRTPNVWER